MIMKAFKENVKKEWGKITWLTKEDVMKQTTVVVVTTFVMSVFISAFDLVGQWLVNLVTGIHF